MTPKEAKEFTVNLKEARAATKKSGHLTNKQFAKQSTEFVNICERIGLKSTHRQASKFRNQRGIAYRAAIGEDVKRMVKNVEESKKSSLI